MDNDAVDVRSFLDVCHSFDERGDVDREEEY
jgi:hypothetical protein